MTTSDHAEIFRGEDGDWYSRVISANGNTIFTGGEGYRNKQDCIDMVQSRFGLIPHETEDSSEPDDVE